MWDPRFALGTAIEAAKEAGAMLRAEFHRPGGPRGSGSSAPIDEEAERAIRARLRAAFPGWAILGEESGREGGASRFLWVVDPNDGTGPFLRGMRGSAVSIGLLRDGEPALGVVYAPTAPDDDGDLIAWAEGLPIIRNGVVVHRAALPDRLGPGQAVLVSQDADRNPEANLRCVSPARYRAVPSIAYRLALVAAGEAEAATSLGGTSAWDLVAGHALLRAVGAELVDERGEPIRYVDGRGGSSRVFGGAPEAARTLAGQPTDDSELALALARTLVRGGFDLDAIREAYVSWLRSGPIDIGNATRQGLQGRPDPGSQANGSLMRVSPLGIFGHGLPPHELGEAARADSAITHPHPICRDASAAFAVAIAHAVRTGEGAIAAYEAANRWAREANADPAVIETLEAASREPPSEYQRHMGWVRIALQNAFYRLLHAPTLEAGVIETVMEGGDTDTNAAIAGALLGAVHGREAVPLRWRRAILACRPIEPRYRLRPPSCWPVDALELAEALLVEGNP